MMVGKIMKAKVKPPLKIDQPNFNLVTKRIKPKRPKMMEGIPARHSEPNRITLVMRLSEVYSVRKMAAPTPRGVAKIKAKMIRTIVPTMVEKIPPSFPISTGFLVRNSQFRTGNPCLRIKKMIKARIKILKAVRAKSSQRITLCSLRGERRHLTKISFSRLG
jgi:hypothetical protein